MTEKESEKNVPSNDDTRLESAICPFTQPKGKRVGNALLAIMFILIPTLLLMYLILVR